MGGHRRALAPREPDRRVPQPPAQAVPLAPRVGQAAGRAAHLEVRGHEEGAAGVGDVEEAAGARDEAAHLRQTIFALQEYVETKGRETDFESIKENCMNIVDKLNKEAKERCLQPMGGLGATTRP